MIAYFEWSALQLSAQVPHNNFIRWLYVNVVFSAAHRKTCKNVSFWTICKYDVHCDGFPIIRRLQVCAICLCSISSWKEWNPVVANTPTESNNHGTYGNGNNRYTLLVVKGPKHKESLVLSKDSYTSLPDFPVRSLASRTMDWCCISEAQIKSAAPATWKQSSWERRVPVPKKNTHQYHITEPVNSRWRERTDLPSPRRSEQSTVNPSMM